MFCCSSGAGTVLSPKAPVPVVPAASAIDTSETAKRRAAYRAMMNLPPVPERPEEVQTPPPSAAASASAAAAAPSSSSSAAAAAAPTSQPTPAAAAAVVSPQAPLRSDHPSLVTLSPAERKERWLQAANKEGPAAASALSLRSTEPAAAAAAVPAATPAAAAGKGATAAASKGAAAATSPAAAGKGAAAASPAAAGKGSSPGSPSALAREAALALPPGSVTGVALTDPSHLAAVRDLALLLNGSWELDADTSQTVEPIMRGLGAPYLVIKAILSMSSPPCIFELTPAGLAINFPGGFFSNKNSYSFAGPSSHNTPDGGKHAAALILHASHPVTGERQPALSTRVQFPKGALLSHHTVGTYDAATRRLTHCLALNLIEAKPINPKVPVIKVYRVYSRVLDLQDSEADRAVLEAWTRFTKK